VSTAIAAIYGRIAWGMFERFDDFTDHLLWAQQLYETGLPAMPHFLFHGLTALLYASPWFRSLLTAGASVIIGAYFMLGVATYAFLWNGLGQYRHSAPWLLGLMTIATIVAQPITLEPAYALGYLWSEPYHSATYSLLKPFALAGFAFTTWFISRHQRVRADVVALFAVVIVLGALSKPNFIICLLPAAAAVSAFRLWRGLPLNAGALVAGLFIPAILVLGWQFLVTFSGVDVVAGMYRDSVTWSPMKFMDYWATGLSTKFAASAMFPIAVAAFYWPHVRRDTMMQLAWLCFAFGVLFTYGVVQEVDWTSGDFVWSGYISLFILLVATTVFWLRQLTTGLRGWVLARALICGAVFVLHVASGARLAWLYLTHFACRVDLRLVQFVCD